MNLFQRIYFVLLLIGFGLVLAVLVIQHRVGTSKSGDSTAAYRQYP